MAELRHRPIFGGVFGMGQYALASIPCVVKGLHAVRFMVIEPTSGAVLSMAHDKVAALGAARHFIRQSDQLKAADEAPEGDPRQLEIWPRAEGVPRPIVDKRRPVSRRRRDIFAKCGGHCHYCNSTLTLDGSWHVEHMFPRALGGQDEISNLVAACVPCNLSKRDRTAFEFVAQRQDEQGGDG